MKPYYLLEEKLLRRNLETIKHVADTAGVEIQQAALMKLFFLSVSLEVWHILIVLPIQKRISPLFWIVAVTLHLIPFRSTIVSCLWLMLTRNTGSALG